MLRTEAIAETLRRTRAAATAAAALLCAGALLAPAPAAAQQNPMATTTLADGIPGVHGVARHPDGSVYVTQLDAGQISVIRNGRAENALAPGWTVSEDLPRWAIKDDVPLSAWQAAKLDHPGPIAISTNGTLFVAEQVPNGRLLSFPPNPETGAYDTAVAIPVPWLDQQFQWHDIVVDNYDRLYVVGMDEIGPDFMKFGSALVRDQEGDWWVMDFGPFARFSTMALSDRQDAMLLGDKAHGNVSWWEVNRHIMMGGSPEVAGRSSLQSLAFYPDGSFVIGQIDSPTAASVVRMDPFSGQQVPLVSGLKSLGDIAMDRAKGCLYITDPAAGRVIEATPNPPMAYNEVAIRQIVRSIEGMSGVASEAPAFLNNFFDRLQDAAKDLLPDDSTHSVQFTLSDIAGKMPIVAGRVQTVVTVEGAEADPIDTLEFFLLFPSKFVMTEDSATPSLSFFSLKRKSGKIEQTKPVFKNDVGVYRLSGTNIFKIGTSSGGLYVPVVTCGLKPSDDGIGIDLAFLGTGVYDDYYLSLFQGPMQQTATLVVNADGSGTNDASTVTYEATFMEEATIEGLKGKSQEKMSNLLISGFSGGGAGANRSVGWLRLGKFPAQATVSYGDSDTAIALAGAGGLKDVLDKKELELRQAAAAELATEEEEEVGETVSEELISAAHAAAAAAQAAAADEAEAGAGGGRAVEEDDAP